jgi:hypothetical protein
MVGFRSGDAEVTQYIRRLRGGSRAALVRASDGLLYILKSSISAQGPNLPFNECVGTEIYRACGLLAPPWRKLLVTDSFIEHNRGFWADGGDGANRPIPGLWFGSFVVGQGLTKFQEILDGRSYKRIRDRNSFWLAWLIDICAEHDDHRQCVFKQTAAGEFDAFFIDHGSLFGGGFGDQEPKPVKSRYLDARIYPEVRGGDCPFDLKTLRDFNVDKLWAYVQVLPEEWRTESGSRSLARCLNRFADPALLNELFTSILDMIMLRNRDIEDEGQRRWRLQFAVLHPGVHTGCQD